MKVYLLYSNPYDEGYDVYGAFSTLRKAAKARKLFSSKSNHELRIECIDVDELEKNFERAKSSKRLYTLHRTRFDFGRISYGGWSVSACGLDSFFNHEDGKEDYVVEFERWVSATILAESEQEAVEIADRMIEQGKVLYYEIKSPSK